MILLASNNQNPVKSERPPPVLIEVMNPNNPDIFSWEDALDSGLPILGIGRDLGEVL